MTTCMLVFSNPVEGREDEYNDWYDTIHLQEVVSLGGITSAQRFRIEESQVQADQPHRYLAIYEIEDGFAESAVNNLLGGTGSMQMTDAIDMTSAKVCVFSSIGPVVQGSS